MKIIKNLTSKQESLNIKLKCNFFYLLVIGESCRKNTNLSNFVNLSNKTLLELSGLFLTSIVAFFNTCLCIKKETILRQTQFQIHFTPSIPTPFPSEVNKSFGYDQTTFFHCLKKEFFFIHELISKVCMHLAVLYTSAYIIKL